MANPLLFYDGVCGLCNRLVQFILSRDPDRIFRFASLQSPPAARVLARHNVNAADLDAVYLILNCDAPSESILARSDAILFVLQKLGGLWRAVALVLRLIPRPVREWAYRQVARNRYRIFGRYDSCPAPSEDTRSRFLDL